MKIRQILEKNGNNWQLSLVCEDLCLGHIVYNQIEDEAEIHDIFVEEAYRRQGFGEMLVSEMMKSLRKLPEIKLYLEVRASNIAAISLYDKLGFQEINRRKDYYSSPKEDAIIMTTKKQLNNRPLILAIETSCDETSIAITQGWKVLALEINSQIAIHEPFGGVVPEVASRHHLENINKLVDLALEKSKMKLEDIDAIAVTMGPGLIGALVIGIATAKGLALAADKPLLGINHIQGHIAAVYIEHPELEPPFLAFIASGGHTEITLVKSYQEMEILGSTRDDAIGEAFDKVARVIGLGYPGGPKLDEIAKKGDREAIKFKRVFLDEDGFDFSFSGLKTQVINTLQRLEKLGQIPKPEDIAASFQEAVMDVVAAKLRLAIKKTGVRKLAVVGGVAANSRLRAISAKLCAEMAATLYIPSTIYCTDNAAMIGVAADIKLRGTLDTAAGALLSKIKSELGMDAWARLG